MSRLEDARVGQLTGSLAFSAVIIGICVVVLIAYISYSPRFESGLKDNILQVAILDGSGAVVKNGGLDVLTDIPKSGEILSLLVKNPVDTFEGASAKMLYLTPMQSPLRIKDHGSIIFTEGDFENNIPPKSMDILFPQRMLGSRREMLIETRLSSLSGSHLVFLQRSGFGNRSDLLITRFFKNFLTDTGNLTLSAIFFALAAVLLLLRLNLGGTQRLLFLMLATVFQAWIALWFSREIYGILINTDNLHKIGFIIYFLFFASYGSFLKSSTTSKLWNNIYAVFCIGGAAIAALLLVFGFSLNLAGAFRIYKYSLPLAFLGYFTFAVGETCTASEKKLEFTVFHILLPLAAWLIAFGHANDILRVYSLLMSPYNVGPYSFFLGLILYMTSIVYYVYAHHQHALVKEKEYSKLATIRDLSAQVAHDIRSPLAALDAALKNTSQLPEKQRVMVRHAVNRIRDIANNLLEQNRQQPRKTGGGHVTGEPLEIRLLSSLIDPVITEKRLQFESKPGINIDFELTKESYGLFAEIRPVEFRRMVSNLVNNAVEAVESHKSQDTGHKQEGTKGEVTISLASEDGTILLVIKDSGKGIPPEILAKLGQKGETHGKVGG
ncbi:MAG: HAMP domain-containing sensor histidine kinase, partial [Elusimicrobiota bacterium]